MKQTVRTNVFETNSSSIHSLAISQETVLEEEIDPKTYEAEVESNGEFGWGLEYITDPVEKLKYMYIMALEFATYRGEDRYLEKLKKKFPNVWFKEPDKNQKYFDGYVDHATDKEELIQEMLRDVEKFMNRGIIILSNDNCDYQKPIDKYLDKHKAQIVASGGN